MSHEWILLRGLGREKQHSEEFIKKLTHADPEGRVIPIDLPGAGDYHRLSSPMSMEGIAEFVYSHLPQERAEKRHMVAISLGGMVAVEMLRLHPEAVDSLVLINSSFKKISSLFERLQPEALWHMVRALTATSVSDRERQVLNMVSNHPQKHQWIEPWSEIARSRPVVAFNFIKQLIAAATYELPLKKPEAPIYVLTSDGDRMVSPKCSKKLAEHWELPIAIHPTAGHELYIDDPEWVIEQLFLFCGR